jgi:hypothetical protein
MNPRTSFVLIVMTLAVFAALFPAPPDETVLLAATQDESSGAAAARAGWR